ncbi:MAG: WD40 repeat domain-containing protein [Elusimicrobiales bacterium]|jgi:WD40 repeat protein|nr:WD40 repeat domain-containing protein [Elusimicrobiales bacterium]
MKMSAVLMLLALPVSGQEKSAAEGKAPAPERPALMEPAGVLRGHSSAVQALAFSPDGRWMVSGGMDSMAVVWDAAKWKIKKKVLTSAGNVLSVDVSEAGDYFLTAGGNSAEAWTCPGAKLERSFTGHTPAIYAAVFSRTGAEVALAGFKSAAVYPFAGGQRRVIPGHEAGIYDLEFSFEGSQLITGGADGKAGVWRVRDGEAVRSIDAHPGGVRKIALSRSGLLLATAGMDGYARLWRVADGGRLLELNAHSGGARAVALSDDASLIATGGLDGSARIWSAKNGKQLAELYGHSDGVEAAAFSPDGRWLATASRDGTIRIWPVFKLQKGKAEGKAAKK